MNHKESNKEFERCDYCGLPLLDCENKMCDFCKNMKNSVIKDV